MVKRIKNWDKLNNTHIGYAGTFYEILTDKVIETDTESAYSFGLWNLKEFVLSGKLVITQSTQTDLTTGEKKKRDEYIVKLRTYDSSNLVNQYIMFEEHVKNFDLFKGYLSQVCQQMLSKIEEANEWKIQNGYTT
jgi:hypothetical protein